MKLISTTILLVLYFSLHGQGGSPIPMPEEIVPDTIYCTKDYDSIVVAGICQKSDMNNISYKGFALYELKETKYSCFEIWRIQNDGGQNCNLAKIPTDSLDKYDLNQFAVKNADLNSFQCIYSLISKEKNMRKKGALFDYEYNLKIEIYIQDEIWETDRIRIGTDNKNWKELKPVEIFTWRISKKDEMIMMVKYHNYYLNDQKVNYRERIEKIYKIKCKKDLK